MDGLTPFEKKFYVESPSVAAMSEAEVEEYRLRREITVEGKDVPKPVKSFQDVGFPGNRDFVFVDFSVKVRIIYTNAYLLPLRAPNHLVVWLWEKEPRT